RIAFRTEPRDGFGSAPKIDVVNALEALVQGQPSKRLPVRNEALMRENRRALGIVEGHAVMIAVTCLPVIPEPALFARARNDGVSVTPTTKPIIATARR